MGRNTPRTTPGKDTPPLQNQRRKSKKFGDSFEQLSCGRRILASKYQRRGRPTISTSSIWSENPTHSIIELHLNYSNGMRVVRGILESQQQTGDDVAGFVLFPHQVAVRVTEVNAYGGHESTEDGQELRECIGEIVRWFSSFIEAINMVPEATRKKTKTSKAFDFNEDSHLKETIILGNMEDCKEVDDFESMDPSGTQEIMTNAQTTCNISGVDGLPSNLPNRKYTMTERVRKEK